jgi:hypothetical protein
MSSGWLAFLPMPVDRRACGRASRNGSYRREGGTTIDILVLVDRLEELFRRGSRVPLTRRVIVDEQAFLDIIDQMRIAVPEEIRMAKRITDERNRILTQAQEDAERMRSDAQKEAMTLLSKDARLAAFDARSKQLMEAAEIHAQQLKSEADDHCVSVLTALESEVSSILTTTRNGIQHLQATATALKGSESQPSEKGR